VVQCPHLVVGRLVPLVITILGIQLDLVKDLSLVRSVYVLSVIVQIICEHTVLGLEQTVMLVIQHNTKTINLVRNFKTLLAYKDLNLINVLNRNKQLLIDSILELRILCPALM